jgi:hypothetical protein
MPLRGEFGSRNVARSTDVTPRTAAHRRHALPTMAEERIGIIA